MDRHEHIGRGCIGVHAFGVICSDPRTQQVPKIMETPKDKAPDGLEWDAHNLKLLRGLAAGKKMRLKAFAAAEPMAKPPAKGKAPRRR